ncbi:MAG: hypothetical protein SCALA702_14260 [Melioribacteraceae bacterium]|nr:MAG: hypothetical protein SCALA702_14260 [Melioribacteraceae bacterium]
MIKRNLVIKTFGLTLLFLFVLAGCERDPDILEPAEYPSVPEVFIDGFSSGLNYAAFGGSRVDAFDVDTEVKYSGSSSMKIEVPDFEDPYGAYAGGVYYTSVGRNLSGFDALTFRAKATKPAEIDVLGIGNDLGEAKYQATRSGMKINANWKKYYIPIPDPSKWVAERGMFFYSEGPEDGSGYTIWFDEVKYEKTGLLAHPRPSILEQQDQNIDAAIGDLLPIGGTFVTYNFPDGTDKRIDAAPAYFTYTSSDESVATVDEYGQISAISMGTAVITAQLAGVDADGSITLNVGEARPAPAQPAPAPTVPAADVISMFSNAYTNVPVDTWATYWEFSTTEYEEIQIAGDDVKLYTKLNFNGIEFASQTIDASSMTRFHMDIWTPDATDLPAEFKVLLVDFGADGAYDGGDDASHELTFTASTTPALATEEWVSLDVPLSAFTGLTTKGHLGQLVISGDPNTVYVDNVYFYDDGSGGGGGGSGEPTEPAPTPTANSADVISIYSDAYTNVGANYFPSWGQATAASEISISGNNTLKYAGFDYQGIELASSIDVSGMGSLHLDIWTENSTEFNFYLISPGPVEQAYSVSVPTTGWQTVDIPITSFASVDLTDVIQLKSDGNGDIYLDNIYFNTGGGGGGGSEPTSAAPTPTYPAGDVISLYSNAYTNNTVDTWSADWDDADVADVQVAGDDTKLYSNLVFAGIEFTSQTVDASGLTHFRMDIWTPDPTALPNVFKIKLVDFGADGAFDGGDDVEHELTFNASSTPALATGQWITFDIPLGDFTGLTTKGHLAQLILVGETIPTVYVDNILFHK